MIVVNSIYGYDVSSRCLVRSIIGGSQISTIYLVQHSFSSFFLFSREDKWYTPGEGGGSVESAKVRDELSASGVVENNSRLPDG